MNWMNIKKLASVAFVATSMGFASQAFALDTDSPQYMGYYTPPEPADATSEATYVNTLNNYNINTVNVESGVTYNRSANSLCYSACPDVLATNASKVDSPSTGNVNLGSGGYLYLIGKYDGPNGGGVVWYVAGMTGVVTIPTSWGPSADKSYGLSHWTLFSSGSSSSSSSSSGQLSEPGTTAIALLGLGLLGAALRSRRRVK
jgi:MYXO-CTERM domain-containing protein